MPKEERPRKHQPFESMKLNAVETLLECWQLTMEVSKDNEVSIVRPSTLNRSCYWGVLLREILTMLFLLLK